MQSLIAVGAIFGSPIGGWAIDRLGRKTAIVLCGVPLDLGWLLITYAQNHAMLYAGRLITGLGIGIVSLSVPVCLFCMLLIFSFNLTLLHTSICKQETLFALKL